MTDQIIKSHIRCGAKASRPLRRMCQSASKYGYFGVDPWEFTCEDCGCQWSGTAVSVGTDLSMVSCSNCYSDNVILTAYRVEIPEKGDFNQ